MTDLTTTQKLLQIQEILESITIGDVDDDFGEDDEDTYLQINEISFKVSEILYNKKD